MSARALIAQRGEVYAVTAPVKLRHVDGVASATSIQYLPTLEAARDFCLCCDYNWSLVVPPLDLKPPRGSAA